MSDWDTQPEIKIQQNILSMTDTKCIFYAHILNNWEHIVLDLCVCMYVCTSLCMFLRPNSLERRQH